MLHLIYPLNHIIKLFTLNNNFAIKIFFLIFIKNASIAINIPRPEWLLNVDILGPTLKDHETKNSIKIYKSANFWNINFV